MATNDKYAELRAAIKRSTPGEWAVGAAYSDDEGYVELPIFSTHEGKSLAPMAIALQFPYVRGMQESNASLVVLAHNLVPDLLAERDRLVAVAQEYSDLLRHLDAGGEHTSFIAALTQQEQS